MSWKLDTSRRDFTATTLALLILAVVSMWAAIMVFQALRTNILFEGSSLAGGRYHFAGAIDVSSWRRYANRTAGFAVLYPNDWYVEDVAVDQDSDGDPVMNGVTSPFQIGVAQVGGLGVKITHKLPEYDNKPIAKQWDGVLAASRPFSGDYREFKSIGGISYLRIFAEDADGGGRLLAYVPTGKYVLAFQVENPNNANEVKIFDAMLRTVELR